MASLSIMQIYANQPSPCDEPSFLLLRQSFSMKKLLLSGKWEAADEPLQSRDRSQHPQSANCSRANPICKWGRWVASRIATIKLHKHGWNSEGTCTIHWTISLKIELRAIGSSCDESQIDLIRLKFTKCSKYDQIWATCRLKCAEPSSQFSFLNSNYNGLNLI